MVDTPRTTAYLTGTQWVDTGAAGRDTPQSMRDLVVSGPQWDAVGGVASPNILRGKVDIGGYFTSLGGVISTAVGQQNLATRQNNATQLQAAFDYAANSNKYAEGQPNIIEIDNTTGINFGPGASYAGFRFNGSKDPTFIIAQYHTGAPVLSIGDMTGANANMEGMIIDGISIQYLGSVSTGNVLQLGHLYQSELRNFNVYGGFGVSYLVYIGNTSGTANFFSNNVTNLNGLSANAGFLFWNGTATGCAWSNTYFQNLLSTTPQTLTQAAIYLNNPAGNAAPDESVFDQLNCEHFACNNPFFINQGGFTLISPHFENVVMIGANPVFFSMANPRSGVTIIGGNTVSLQLNSSNMTGTATWVSYYDECCFLSYGHKFIVNTSQLQTVNMPLQLFSQGAGETPSVIKIDCKIDGLHIDRSYQGHVSIDATLARATYGDIEYVDGYNGAAVFPRCRRTVIDDPPTNTVIYGAMGEQVIVRYNNVIGGNLVLVLGHFMTASGAGSATQRPLGDQVLVTRESAATGAFTITVKDATSGGTTISTVFTSGTVGVSQGFSYSAPVSVSYAPVWAAA